MTMTESTPPRQPIRTDGSNSFCYQTFKQRLPRIIREVQSYNPALHPTRQAALDDLHDALVADAHIAPLALPAPDADLWTPLLAQHTGATWLNTEWYFAEHYFFRLILQATRYFEEGIDPYAPVKLREIESDGFRALLRATVGRAQHLSQVIEWALWGNRIDLSHPSGLQSARDLVAGDLLVDDRPAVISHLQQASGSIHLVADNFGSELMMDLRLIDHLLSLRFSVVLHLKQHPTYVSDATLADFHLLVGRLQQGVYDEDDAFTAQLGGRLLDALAAGQLRLAPDFYWNSPRWLDDLPPRLSALFAEAALVILKGDANYRRAVFDTITPIEVSFAQATAYFPAPLLALRTLKSDPAPGLPADRVQALDAQHDDNWRVTGRYGVIQFKR